MQHILFTFAQEIKTERFGIWKKQRNTAVVASATNIIMATNTIMVVNTSTNIVTNTIIVMNIVMTIMAVAVAATAKRKVR